MKLDELICQQLEVHSSECESQVSEYIFRRYYGIQCEAMSLDILGQKFGFSRQNATNRLQTVVRKIQSKIPTEELNKEIRRSWKKGTLLHDFYKTRNLFESEERYIAFLAKLSGLERSDITLHTKKKCSELLEVFCTENSPITEKALINYLDCSEGEAHNLVRKCVNEHFLTLRDGLYYPQNLPRKVALAHAFLMSKKTDSIGNMLTNALQLGFLSEEKYKCESYNRIKTECIHQGYIVTFGGEDFQHTKYVEISDNDVELVLQLGKKCLEESKIGSIDIKSIYLSQTNTNLCY